MRWNPMIAAVAATAAALLLLAASPLHAQTQTASVRSSTARTSSSSSSSGSRRSSSTGSSRSSSGAGVASSTGTEEAPPFQLMVSVGRTGIFRLANDSALAYPPFFFKAQMTIDGDGAPNCYGPGDVGTLDFLSNAGYPGNWWALVTDTLQPSGTPLLQGPDDPYPGLYISMTSLSDKKFAPTDTRRWVDATVIPYVVLPPHQDFKRATRVKLGDLGVVMWNGKWSYAIFADESGDNLGTHVGEGSVALAQKLGHNPFNAVKKIAYSIDPVSVYYFMFPNSGISQPLTLGEIESLGAMRLAQWGGIERVRWITEQWPWHASQVPPPLDGGGGGGGGGGDDWGVDSAAAVAGWTPLVLVTSLLMLALGAYARRVHLK